MNRILLALVLLAISSCDPIYAADTIGNDPRPVDLNIQAGEDFRVAMQFRNYSTPNDKTGKVMDLTGYSFRAQAATASPGPAFGTFSTVVTSPPQGTMTLSMSKARTKTYTGKTGYWDLMLIDPSGLVKYLFKGIVKFLSTVTR